MATDIKTGPLSADVPGEVRIIPELRAGDRLSRAEFERRYEAMPHVKKAELIEGVVYMPAAVRAEEHSEPHALVVTWLGNYSCGTPGVKAGDNGTLRLDLNNAPQPDGYLRLLPEYGGNACIEDGYVTDAPELIVEVSASSASYDLHDKKTAYLRSGVQEYIVWRVLDQEIDWFVLQDTEYILLPRDEDGLFRSHVFPGLWLDPDALVAEEGTQVMKSLQFGIKSEEHVAFISELRQRRGET